MANWIAHMMIADALMDMGLEVDKTGFCVGNIAPDCNVENEDWTEFTPSREVTHWMTGSEKDSADYEGFYDRYMSRNDFRAFKIGVCYAEQLVGSIPMEPHDMKMDFVVYK